MLRALREISIFVYLIHDTSLDGMGLHGNDGNSVKLGYSRTRVHKTFDLRLNHIRKIIQNATRNWMHCHGSLGHAVASGGWFKTENSRRQSFFLPNFFPPGDWLKCRILHANVSALVMVELTLNIKSNPCAGVAVNVDLKQVNLQFSTCSIYKKFLEITIDSIKIKIYNPSLRLMTLKRANSAVRWIWGLAPMLMTFGWLPSTSAKSGKWESTAAINYDGKKGPSAKSPSA